MPANSRWDLIRRLRVKHRGHQSLQFRLLTGFVFFVCYVAECQFQSPATVRLDCTLHDEDGKVAVPARRQHSANR